VSCFAALPRAESRAQDQQGSSDSGAKSRRTGQCVVVSINHTAVVKRVVNFYPLLGPKGFLTSTCHVLDTFDTSSSASRRLHRARGFVSFKVAGVGTASQMETFVLQNRASIAPFLTKLWEILEDHTTDHIVRWAPGGTAFEVPQPALLASVVLPSFFRSNNFGSFQRQLNYFGFRKAGGGAHWAHASFLRSQPELLRLIKRKTRKHTTLPCSNAASADAKRAHFQGEGVREREVEGGGDGMPCPRKRGPAEASAMPVAGAEPCAPSAKRSKAAHSYSNDPELKPVSPITPAGALQTPPSWAMAAANAGMPAKGSLLSGALLRHVRQHV
jgi:hypothetical protein